MLNGFVKIFKLRFFTFLENVSVYPSTDETNFESALTNELLRRGS